MDKKAWPTHMLPTRDPPPDKRPTQTENEGLETNFPSKWTWKKAGVAILLTDKIDFKKKFIKRDPEVHFIILKDRIYQENRHWKYLWTQHRSTHIYKENLGGLQERYWQQHNYSRRFKCPAVKIGQIFQTKYQQAIVALNNP